jgi:hypothetical protein
VTVNTPLDNLRPGEDPGSNYPGDTRHWVGVYSELLRLLDEAVLELEGERQLSRDELEGYRLLFEKRLAFWEGRLRTHEKPSLRRRVRDRADASTDAAPFSGPTSPPP